MDGFLEVILIYNDKDYYIGRVADDGSNSVELTVDLGLDDKIDIDVLKYIKAGFKYGYDIAMQELKCGGDVDGKDDA